MNNSVGGRAFAIRGAVLAFAALASGACGRGLGNGSAPDASTDGRSGDDVSSESGIVDVGEITGTGPLILQAWGGVAGEVAAQVPLIEPGVGPQQTCTDPLAAGACLLTSCQVGGISSPRAGYGNFGPITASVGATTVPINYTGYGYPTVYFPSPITLGTGGTMTFHGGNVAGVPAFDVSATIPGIGVITSPVPATDGGAAIIDTSKDLSVTWLPISIGQVRFHLDGGTSSPGGVAISLSCMFEGASGAGVVPHTLLSSLKEMSGTSATYAGLSSKLEATTVVDGLTIVTQSFQNSSPIARDFNVTLQ